MPGWPTTFYPGPPPGGRRTHVRSGRQNPGRHRSAAAASEDPGAGSDGADLKCTEQAALLSVFLTDLLLNLSTFSFKDHDEEGGSMTKLRCSSILYGQSKFPTLERLTFNSFFHQKENTQKMGLADAHKIGNSIFIYF